MLMNVLEEERPTPGRPQGSHPLTLTPPALTKIRGSDESHRIFVRAGVGLTRGGDPCGRPGVGVWPYKYRFLEKNVERKSISSTGERHGSRITIHSDILTSMKPLSCDTC